MLRLVVCLTGLGAGLLVSGCKTMDTTNVTGFAASVTAVKGQADDALNAATALTRDASVSFAATQPTLSEANFVVTPTSDTVAVWDGAFNALQNYAQNLATLLSPNVSKNFDAAATGLFDEFNQTAKQVKARSMLADPDRNALLATAFTEVAGAIIRAKQEATAIKMAGATDTNIAAICQLLADEIGADRTNSPGLRQTVYRAVWAPRLASLTVPFLGASAADKAGICQQYADLLAKRDAEDQVLASLRHSILALADAHHVLAQGQPASMQADLAAISVEVQHTHDLLNQFSNLAKK